VAVELGVAVSVEVGVGEAVSVGVLTVRALMVSATAVEMKELPGPYSVLWMYQW